MHIIIDIESHLATLPQIARVKPAYQRITIEFRRGGRKHLLGAEASIALGFKERNKFDDAPIIVFHDDFFCDDGLYVGLVNFATEELYALLGIQDDSSSNDKPSVSLAGEIVWTIGDKSSRSQTFYLAAEPYLLTGDNPTPAEPALAILHGRPVELQHSPTHLQWRYVGNTEWVDLVALSMIAGPDGDPAEPEAIMITAAAGIVPVALTRFAVLGLTLADNTTLEQSGSIAPGSICNINVVNPNEHMLSFGASIDIDWCDGDALPSVPPDGCIVSLVWRGVGSWKGAWRT